MSRVRRRPRGAATRKRGVAAAFKAGKVIKGKRPTKPRTLVKTTTRPKPTVKGGRVQKNKDMAKAATRPRVAKPTVKPKPNVGIKPSPVKPRPPVRARGPRRAMAAGFAGLRKMI